MPRNVKVHWHEHQHFLWRGFSDPGAFRREIRVAKIVCKENSAESEDEDSEDSAEEDSKDNSQEELIGDRPGDEETESDQDEADEIHNKQKPCCYWVEVAQFNVKDFSNHNAVLCAVNMRLVNYCIHSFQKKIIIQSQKAQTSEAGNS